MSFSSTSSESTELLLGELNPAPRDAPVPAYPVRVYKSGGYWTTGGYCSLEVQAFDALGRRVFDYHFNNGGSQTGSSRFDTPGCGYYLMGTLADEFSPSVYVNSIVLGFNWPCAIYVGPGDLSNIHLAFGTNHDLDMSLYCDNEGGEPPPPYESSSFYSNSSSSSYFCIYEWADYYYCDYNGPYGHWLHYPPNVYCQNPSTIFLPFDTFIITEIGARQYFVQYLKKGDKCPHAIVSCTNQPPPPNWSSCSDLDCSSISSSMLSDLSSSSSISSSSLLMSSNESSRSTSSDSSRSSLSSLSSIPSGSSISTSNSTTSISSLSSESSDSSQSILCTYLTDCSSIKAITSPLAGKGTSDISFVGNFDVENQPEDYLDPEDAHEQKGSLVKTPWNLGTIFTPDAGKLFSCGRGMLIMRLSLPYDIQNGIYGPLAGISGTTLTDLILWGVNFGDYYITPPGLYAAFTPSGIEFTVWTSANKITLKDVSSNVSSGQDVVMKFCWDHSQLWMSNTVALYVNNVLVDWSNEPISNDGFSSLYSISGGSYANANFYCMDSPSGKNSLNGILRRLAIYRRPIAT